MDEPQIIKTPTGDEMVVLSRREYDALVDALTEAQEELADIAVLDERKAELARGEAVSLPAEVSALLLDGRTRLQALREWRGLDRTALAAQSGLDVALSASVEAGQPVPAEASSRLAGALKGPLSWIT